LSSISIFSAISHGETISKDSLSQWTQVPPEMAESPASDLHKPKESTVIYGLSSEGFQIGAKLAAKGYQVTMIDELLGTAMELRPEIAGDYRDLRSLLADEPLMEIRSKKESISAAKVIFFVPRLRRKDEEILAEVKTRIVEATKTMSPDTVFVFCLPLGIGGTKEIIDRIEHSSGLVNGKDFWFSYSPLDIEGKPSVFGCDGKNPPYSKVVEAAGLGTEVVGLLKAELVHAQKVVAKYSNLASAFETARHLTQMGTDSPREYRQIFCEDLSSNQFDLNLVLDSLDNGEPILYLASGANKSIEAYGRFLVERVREFVRLKDLKASRLKIILFSDTDILEMRGDRLRLALDLVERLRDYFSDIDNLNVMKQDFSFPTGLDKTNLLVFLSGSVELRLMQLYEEQIEMTRSHMIRANLPVEFLS
jgi:hypothetical protein